MHIAGNPLTESEVGPGDDAAAWRAPAHGLVVSSIDTLCEDVDFRRQYQTPYQVGWKAWMAAVSDLSAMGATPKGGLVALALPDDTTASALQAIQLGLVEAAAVDCAAVAGGDLSRSPGPLVVTVTVIGEVPDGDPVTLGGASPRDQLVVTGSLGLAASALQLVEAGTKPVPQAWLERLVTPQSRVEAGLALRRAGATAMTDISDGLLLDLERLCQASGVGADLWLDQVPRGSGVGNTLADLERVLTGGEDFELLAAIPEHQATAVVGSWERALPAVTLIGLVTDQAGIRLFRTRGGEQVEAPTAGGFRHF